MVINIPSISSFLSDKMEIDTVEKFLNMNLRGICAVTVAKDRGSLCGTFIFDYDTKTMLKHYPGRFQCNSPIYRNGWTINVATNLPKIKATGKASDVPEDPSYYPFCCEHCSILYKRRLSNDDIFSQFKAKWGSVNEKIFRVVKKIQHGDLVFLKYFKLDDGNVIEATPTPYKLNSFKVYTCDVHNTYYSVDLHTVKDRYNRHHAKGQNETEFSQELLNELKS